MRPVLRSYWVTRASTLLALAEPLRTLIVTITEDGATDEGAQVAVSDTDFDAAIVDFGDRAGDHSTLADAAFRGCCFSGIGGRLFGADALRNLMEVLAVALLRGRPCPRERVFPAQGTM